MIEDAVDTVRENFRLNGCPVPVLCGPEFLAENSAPPRVVFVPGEEGDAFEPPIAVQQRQGVDHSQQPYQNPRTIATRWCGAAVHIWAAGILQQDPALQNAADRAALGALVNQTIAAIHQQGFGFYRLLGGQQIRDPKLIRDGLLYVLRVQIAVPVLEIPWVTAAPFGAQAATKTGNTWTNVSGIKPRIVESFNPTGQPKTVIEP